MPNDTRDRDDLHPKDFQQLWDREDHNHQPRSADINPPTIPTGTGEMPHRPARAQATQHLHDISAFLIDVEARENAGKVVPLPQSRNAVLGSFTSPIDQTRVQVLAAAAAAHHLQGDQSPSAQRLHQLAQDNGARLQALRDHERRTSLIGYHANGSSADEIGAAEQLRTEQEADQDRRVFNAAAAIALGYVALGVTPAYTELAALSESQLGPVPVEPATEHPAQHRQQAVKDLLTTVGTGLTQAVGPLAGDDDVAAHLSPINLTHVADQLSELAAALQAAQSGHRRSIKELLNIEQRPDEDNEALLDQDWAHERDLEVAATM